MEEDLEITGTRPDYSLPDDEYEQPKAKPKRKKRGLKKKDKVVLGVGASRRGTVRGTDDSKPKYIFFSWSCLFLVLPFIEA
jgi:hypothetical protein